MGAEVAIRSGALATWLVRLHQGVEKFGKRKFQSLDGFTGNLELWITCFRGVSYESSSLRSVFRDSRFGGFLVGRCGQD